MLLVFIPFPLLVFNPFPLLIFNPFLGSTRCDFTKPLLTSLSLQSVIDAMDRLQPRVQINEAENVARAHYIRDVVSQKSFDGFTEVSENCVLSGLVLLWRSNCA